MSPLRALQFSSALDPSRGSQTPSKEVLSLQKQIAEKNNEILKLKQASIQLTPVKGPIKLENPFPNTLAYKILYGPQDPYTLTPNIQSSYVNTLNPKPSVFNPITGENKYFPRDSSPFKSLGRRFVDGSMYRP